MGKGKTMFSEHVVNSDEFMGLSVESQALYFHLNLDADTLGELSGARRLARGYGFGADELEELRKAGYLLQLGERWFVAHYYEHNNVPSNDGMKKSFANLWNKRPGELAFEGEVCRSKYTVSRELAEQQANISEALASKDKGNRNGKGSNKGTDISKVPATSPKANALGRMGVPGGREPTDLPPCPACGQLHDLEGEEGMERMRCPETGRTYWLEESEWR
ncbi:MAG: hypothetical protein E7000_04325 [Coriobacteriaceae bacterium]|nr:hypothetical protein [Coriobacteriaceae bacterium]